MLNKKYMTLVHGISPFLTSFSKAFLLSILKIPNCLVKDKFSFFIDVLHIVLTVSIIPLKNSSWLKL